MKSLLLFPRYLTLGFLIFATFTAFPQAAPKLSSVSPSDGATQVATTSPIVFVFDQAMDTNVFLVPSLCERRYRRW